MLDVGKALSHAGRGATLEASDEAGPVEHPDATEASATLREAGWRALELRRAQRGAGSEDDPVEGGINWHDSVRRALEHALEEARSVGLSRANRTHLAIGVLRDPIGPVATMFDRADIDRTLFVDRLRRTRSTNRNGRPRSPAAGKLNMTERANAGNPWWMRTLGLIVRRSGIVHGPYGDLLGSYLED
jgi:ATP-dependent Clp protease ATP-binding subunit ClpA